MRFPVQTKGFTGMRLFAVALALSVTLMAAPIHAQAPAAQAPKPAAPAGQTPAAPRPATPPAATTPAIQPKFQDGLKYAYINVQRIAAESSEGKTLADKAKALQDQKVKELNDKNKALQAAQQKLEQGGSVLNDAARAQLQADIERQQRDIQRFTEDAQQDVTALQQQLQDDFMRRLNPVIDKVAREKQLHMVFSAADSGLVWADPLLLDLTGDVIKAFDAAGPAPAAARPATPAPATPAPTTPAPAAARPAVPPPGAK
jgi:Skp family chaperone for outer membrane proteins